MSEDHPQAAPEAVASEPQTPYDEQSQAVEGQEDQLAYESLPGEPDEQEAADKVAAEAAPEVSDEQPAESQQELAHTIDHGDEASGGGEDAPSGDDDSDQTGAPDETQSFQEAFEEDHPNAVVSKDEAHAMANAEAVPRALIENLQHAALPVEAKEAALHVLTEQAAQLAEAASKRYEEAKRVFDDALPVILGNLVAINSGRLPESNIGGLSADEKDGVMGDVYGWSRETAYGFTGKPAPAELSPKELQELARRPDGRFGDAKVVTKSENSPLAIVELHFLNPNGSLRFTKLWAVNADKNPDCVVPGENMAEAS